MALLGIYMHLMHSFGFPSFFLNSAYCWESTSLDIEEHFPNVRLLGADIGVWWVTTPFYSDQWGARKLLSQIESLLVVTVMNNLWILAHICWGVCLSLTYRIKMNSILLHKWTKCQWGKRYVKVSTWSVLYYIQRTIVTRFAEVAVTAYHPSQHSLVSKARYKDTS